MLGLLLGMVQGVAAEVFTARATLVSDGDTLWVQPADGGPTRKLRLQGLDAPEICQSGGEAARAALGALVATKTLKVEVRYYDNYGRGLAKIRVGQEDVGSLMVAAGYAWSSRWRRSLGPYASEEGTARRARRGIFSATEPEQPRDFRQRHGSCYPP